MLLYTIEPDYLKTVDGTTVYYAKEQVFNRIPEIGIYETYLIFRQLNAISDNTSFIDCNFYFSFHLTNGDTVFGNKSPNILLNTIIINDNLSNIEKTNPERFIWKNNPFLVPVNDKNHLNIYYEAFYPYYYDNIFLQSLRIDIYLYKIRDI